MDSRSNLRSVTKTQNKNNREDEFQFDRIPHRQSRSPRSKTIELNQEEKKAFSRSQESLQVEAEEKNSDEEGNEIVGRDTVLASNKFFKSYEDTSREGNGAGK